jgi:hypothetical protein
VRAAPGQIHELALLVGGLAGRLAVAHGLANTSLPPLPVGLTQ